MKDVPTQASVEQPSFMQTLDVPSARSLSMSDLRATTIRPTIDQQHIQRDEFMGNVEKKLGAS